MMQPDRVADVMGGAAILGSRVLSAKDLEAAVVTGLPRQALRLTLARACSSAPQARTMLYRVVPEATYKRRTRLSAAESERTERLARVIAAAEYVWDNRDDAREWLTRPHPELEGRPPIEAALTELGARRAEEILDRLFYGIPG
ncbi:MAG: antitoxin Xre/MbcA/ParS toxin-binding domain-containing protein [Terracidiphilus sp.]